MTQLNIWQTIFLALLQGVSELFPVSSLGHTVIFPGLFGWGNLELNTACGGRSCFLPIITALHLGTSIALILYFWRDWLKVVQTMVNSVKQGEMRRDSDECVTWLVIVGCVPVGLAGVFLKDPLEKLFGSPMLAAAFLVVNGSVLFLAEAWRRRQESSLSKLPPKEREAHFRPLKSLTWKEALIVGSFQVLALVPGFSRSGMIMVGGLSVRLSHEDAARFAFLTGAPVIFGAAAVEIPYLFSQPHILGLVFMGMVLAGIAAFLSTRFLTKYFETGRLTPFAFYCWGAGLIALILFFTVLRGNIA